MERRETKQRRKTRKGREEDEKTLGWFNFEFLYRAPSEDQTQY